MDLQTLTDNFAIPGVLAFAEMPSGLVYASITTPTCTAKLYLQGAHLSSWQPVGHEPVFFLSKRSAFAPGKAIRGGIPIIFPWFGSRTVTAHSPRTDGPSHGFARFSKWDVVFAALADDDLHITLTLDPSDISRLLGYDRFQLAYQLVIGRELGLRLTVANQSDSPLHFEEALHTYFAVGDASRVLLSGLRSAEYLDKTDNLARKLQLTPMLQLTSATDRLYLNTEATVTLDDPSLRRRISVAKTKSSTTVVWNPWSTLSAQLADMAPDDWRTMTCIETANAAENALVLQPGDMHTMKAQIAIEELDSR
jgi:glucose-6-phosphate 1-epimerase